MIRLFENHIFYFVLLFNYGVARPLLRTPFVTDIYRLTFLEKAFTKYCVFIYLSLSGTTILFPRACESSLNSSRRAETLSEIFINSAWLTDQKRLCEFSIGKWRNTCAHMHMYTHMYTFVCILYDKTGIETKNSSLFNCH